jgi:hypothetical protein
MAARGGEGPSRHREHPGSCARTPSARSCVRCVLVGGMRDLVEPRSRGAENGWKFSWWEKVVHSKTRFTRRRAEFKLEVEERWRRPTLTRANSLLRHEGEPRRLSPARARLSPVLSVGRVLGWVLGCPGSTWLVVGRALVAAQPRVLCACILSSCLRRCPGGAALGKRRTINRSTKDIVRT